MTILINPKTPVRLPHTQNKYCSSTDLLTMNKLRQKKENLKIVVQLLVLLIGVKLQHVAYVRAK